MEDWAAVAEVINERVNELGWRQGELAERSHVSRATVREIQHHIVERRRSARTLEALSTALGWHPQHIDAVLRGRRPPEMPEPAGKDGESLWERMDTFERHLSAITDRLDAIQADLTAVIDCAAKIARSGRLSMREIQLRIRLASHALPMHIECITSTGRVHIPLRWIR